MDKKGTLGLLTLAMLAAPLQAKELGALASLSPTDDGVEIQTLDKEKVRLSLLGDGLLHLEAGQHGELTGPGNGKAPIVLDQQHPKVAFKLSQQDGYQLLSTGKIAVRIYPKPLHFAVYHADNRTPYWREEKPLDLGKASEQTLSASGDEHFFGGGQQNGQFEFKGKVLDVSYSGGWEEFDRPSPAPFYMSSKGYGVLRNTWSNGQYDFRSEGYISTRHDEDRFDAYYFFGDGIHQVLDQYTQLTGRPPLLPRWAFEYGDADCYNDGDNVKKPGTVPEGWSDGPTGTTPDVIESVAAKYRQYDMPGGWILPNDGYGCGYTDLPKVVAGLKKYGFHTGLWTESGVEKIAWEVGTAGTRAQKLDVAWTGKGYQFALDANHDAAEGILKNSDSRPFIWTVMGWAGIQRYAVTWTGDQSGSWDYIRWHIPTLIGSGLSGQAYATGDVDGIFGGSPETYTRDLQWKAFTPVFMGMSGWSKAERKHPWWFDEPYRSINRKYLKLKMRLMPYIYTYAHEAAESGAPLVRGLMWDHPQNPHAYDESHKYQFFLGKDFLVAPVYRSQEASKGWRAGIYLPKGQWIDYWDGRVTEAGAGGKVIDMPVTLDKLPVLVRAGAIIPMYPPALFDGQVPKDELTLDIYPYGDSDFSLYEDDGNSRQYQQGAFSQQRIEVSAPEGKAGDIEVKLGAVDGDYQGMEPQRRYKLMLRTRVAPDSLSLDGSRLAKRDSLEALDKAGSGWFFDAKDKFGTLQVRIPKGSVRTGHRLLVETAAGKALAATPAYPKMPKLGTAVAADSLKLVSRPLEEPGQPFENALDGNPGTWFRTSRDQALAYGPPEFVLYLGDRKAITGFDIAPRNDKHWRYGQVKDFEIYMADVNGQWGEPAYKGTLALKEGMQQVRFDKPLVGRLLRFRILSSHDGQGDAMKEEATAKVQDAPFNALEPVKVAPITISEFVLHQQLPGGEAKRQYLSDHPWLAAPQGAAKDKAKGGGAMRMNGLGFAKGLGVAGQSRVDYGLSGPWQGFKADVGIDDSCKGQGLHFQVWGDGRLLYDSGLVAAPAVVKPELDIRGVRLLSLRTLGKGRCGNWANAAVTGLAGAKFEEKP
ncbi:glycoside hydrolase family 31 protein [Gallaecimonas kandeliae]|uniref:TIM-barrel domain-containing protein n=1 Tax=Gallaecimonas kandeliae TaxID=3029055 RepID=UPI002648F4B7|nr:TIM-barrel domain-containing protein [Gallaecimonas kandeliae]WKE65889.1 glycoside hydrolase family 31 protein [Gallaecimonas kandeliae]